MLLTLPLRSRDETRVGTQMHTNPTQGGVELRGHGLETGIK